MMKHLNQRCDAVASPYAYLDMNFDERQKARSRVVASNGERVGVHIERGTSLRDGDGMKTAEGEVFVVRAGREPLSIVRCELPRDLARAAYHLGNRHVRLQVAEKELLYQTDHVLDEMLEHFGLTVEHTEAAFEPEPGAYHRHGQTDDHAHSHSHSHSHEGVDDEETSSVHGGHAHPHVHSH
jgi:urease accessory protein